MLFNLHQNFVLRFAVVIRSAGFTRLSSISHRIRVISTFQDSQSFVPILAGSGLYPQCRILQAHHFLQDQGYIRSAGFSKLTNSRRIRVISVVQDSQSFVLANCYICRISFVPEQVLIYILISFC